ncbi:MAG: hypothetical protein QM765_14955 [Myxococcales bacterium]
MERILAVLLGGLGRLAFVLGHHRQVLGGLAQRRLAVQGGAVDAASVVLAPQPLVDHAQVEPGLGEAVVGLGDGQVLLLQRRPVVDPELLLVGEGLVGVVEQPQRLAADEVLGTNGLVGVRRLGRVPRPGLRLAGLLALVGLGLGAGGRATGQGQREQRGAEEGGWRLEPFHRVGHRLRAT